MLGKLAGRFRRFPLLLKFLDVREMLSVQVHPTKANTNLLPAGRDPEDRSMGRAGSRDRKPHLCGPEARYYCSEFAAGAHERDGGGPTRMVDSEARRRRFSCGQARFTLWAATSWCSRFSRTATLRFAYMTGTMLTRRPESRGHCKSIRRWPALIFRKVRLARVTPVVEAKTPVERERLFDCEHFRLWRLRGAIAVYRRRGATCRACWYASRAQGRSSTRSAIYAVAKGDVFSCLRRSDSAFFGRAEQ